MIAVCRAVAVGLTAGVLAGCGEPARPPAAPRALPPSYIPLTVGPGPAYRPPAGQRPARSSVAGLACSSQLGSRVGLHLELFANRHVVLVPAGIGVADPPSAGSHVRRGRCYYPLVTREPTGVVEMSPDGRTLKLGDLFAVWGQTLSSTQLAGFTGHDVHVFVDGRPVGGDPAEIRLRRHDEIVLETAGYVEPHPTYAFAGRL